MHWVVVDGTRLPKRVGGHPALDFCNTWAGWHERQNARERRNPRREWLKTYETFALWTAYADLVTDRDAVRLRRAASRDPTLANRTLIDARRFRTSVHSAFVDPSDSAALGRLSRWITTAAAAARLRPGTAGVPRWRVPPSSGLLLPLLAVALSTNELLTSDAVVDVKACPGDDCGWLFIDSRGRRRWCSMSSCGNRAKVRAFTARNSRADR